MTGWGDCDDFCTHAFGELLIQQPQLFSKVIEWTNSELFWVRRAAAVVLIPAIRKGYITTDVFKISDLLMSGEHDLVRKGYGWMLKELALKDADTVCEYLTNNAERMPRVAFRYAIEKMTQKQRDMLMKL